jgi:hypothetical protein
MIRNVVLGRLNDGADVSRLEEALAAMRRLEIDGMLSIRAGRDAGLRAGNWDYSITADFADADAYRRYDEQDEHNHLRREYFGPLSAEIARCQFVID